MKQGLVTSEAAETEGRHSPGSPSKPLLEILPLILEVGGFWDTGSEGQDPVSFGEIRVRRPK